MLTPTFRKDQNDSWPLEGGHFVLATNVMLCSQDYFWASQIAISFASHLRSKALFGIGNHYSRNTESATIIVDLVKRKKILFGQNNLYQAHRHMFSKTKSGKQENASTSFLFCLLRFNFFLCLGVRNQVGKENKRIQRRQ